MHGTTFVFIVNYLLFDGHALLMGEIKLYDLSTVLF